jgi:hypothetical protein
MGLYCVEAENFISKLVSGCSLVVAGFKEGLRFLEERKMKFRCDFIGVFVIAAGLFIVMPAEATVIMSGTQLSTTPLNVTVSYDSTSEPLLVRAFALDLRVTNGARITAISNYKVGPSTAESPGYGIFPGSIVIGPDGTVISYGTPVEPAGLPGTLGGLGTSGITVALGTIYSGEENAPGRIGDLFTITVDKACNLTIAPNSLWGGIVLENAASANMVAPVIQIIPEPATVVLIGMGGMLIRQRAKGKR